MGPLPNEKIYQVAKVTRIPHEGRYQLEIQTKKGNLFQSERSYSETGCDVLEARIKEQGTIDASVDRYRWVGIQR